MSQRIFILGAGRFGAHLAARLSEFGCEIILADKNPDRVEDLSREGFNAIEMDVEDKNALRHAGVQEADAVVVSIGENMQGSILSTLLLKELNVKKLVCRALDERHSTVLEKLGADLVVLPTRDMAYRLAERLRDNVLSDRQELCGNYQLAQIRIGSKLDGVKLADASLRQRYGVNVVLVTRPNGDQKLTPLEPLPDLAMEADDMLFISGLREKINRFERECGATAQPK